MINFDDRHEKTYDVDSNDTAVEVQTQTLEADLDSQSLWLWLVREMLALEKGWDSVGDKDTASWVEFWRNMVSENSLELLLGWLWCVLRDLLEGTVSRRKDGVVGLSSVQSLNQVRVVVDELGKLGRVLGLGNELVHSVVGLVVMRRVVWPLSWVMRRMSIVRVVGAMWVIVVLVEEVNGRVSLALHPRLGVKGLVSHAGADLVGESKSLIEGTLDLVLGRLGVLFDCLSDLVKVLLEAVKDVLGLVATVIGLDRNIVQDVLVRQDKGRSQGGQRQDRKVLHIDGNTIKV